VKHATKETNAGFNAPVWKEGREGSKKLVDYVRDLENRRI
jgi:hypothetical protein